MHTPRVLFTEWSSMLIMSHMNSHLLKRGPENFPHKRIHLCISSFRLQRKEVKTNQPTNHYKPKTFHPFMLSFSVLVEFCFSVLYIFFIILLEFHCCCIYNHSTLAEFWKVYFLPLNVAKRNFAWIQNISVLIMQTVVCNFASSFYIIMSIESILKGNHFLD